MNDNLYDTPWNLLNYLDRVEFYTKSVSQSNLTEVLRMLLQAHGKNRIFIFGNGGSISTAAHFANDLKSVSPGFMSICLNDSNTMSCIANDRGYENIFYEQLISLASGNDIAIMISASGNSPNLLKAIEACKYKMMLTIGLVGFDGGKVKDLVDVCVHVKSPVGYYREVEDGHSILCHFIVDCIDKTRESKMSTQVNAGFNRGSINILDDLIDYDDCVGLNRGSLGGLILQDNLDKGGSIDIPSLGIKIENKPKLKENQSYYRIDYTGHGNGFVKDVWYVKKSTYLPEDQEVDHLFKNGGGHHAVWIISDSESLSRDFAVAKNKIDKMSNRSESYVTKDYKITIDKYDSYWVCYDSSHLQVETFDNPFVVDGLGTMVFIRDNSCEGAFMRGKLLLDKFIR